MLNSVNLPSEFDTRYVTQSSGCAIYHCALPEINPEKVADKLRPLFANRPRWNSENYEHGNFFVTQTEVFTKRSNSDFADLISAIEARVATILSATNAHVTSGLATIAAEVETFWGVLYQQGDSAGWHTHQDIYCFQAVYYPVVDEPSPIMFQNEGKDDLEIVPKPGSLVIFSGKTRHKVPEILGSGTRISFACNLVYKSRS